MFKFLFSKNTDIKTIEDENIEIENILSNIVKETYIAKNIVKLKKEIEFEEYKTTKEYRKEYVKSVFRDLKFDIISLQHEAQQDTEHVLNFMDDLDNLESAYEEDIKVNWLPYDEEPAISKIFITLKDVCYYTSVTSTFHNNIIGAFYDDKICIYKHPFKSYYI